MAKVVVTKSKLDTLAQHINTKAGTTGAKTIAQMQAAVDGISTKMSVTWHQCPEAVRNYLANVIYDPSDYSNSQISNYAPATPVVANTKPIGKTVGGVTYYNEVPNVETPFSADSAAGTLKPLDALRWINTTHAPNVRDLGGWACDGGTVKYGLLFRGGEPTANDRAVLVDELGIRHDLNLRGSEVTTDASPLGEDVYFTKADDFNWYSLTNAEAWKINMRCVFDAVTHNEPVYFHCYAGADRTGTLACVLEGLLGMSQSDIDKDYELTCFYYGTGSDNDARRRNESEWTGLIDAINAKDGNTFRDKCVAFVAELGFTAEEINAFRVAMIDGTPETVTPEIETYSITATLSDGLSTDNTDTAIDQYQPYAANIEASEGYAISNITVTMGGADITAQVWSGSETILRYAVTHTLAGCTSNNRSKTAVAGGGYADILTANDGYTLDGATVTITMGGEDMSNYYSGGVIAIPKVTGNIEITVEAVAQSTNYTNQLPISIDSDGSIYNGVGYKEGYRLNSSGAEKQITESYYDTAVCSTGFIPCVAGDVIRVSGMVIDPNDAQAGSYNVCIYDSSFTKVGGMPWKSLVNMSSTTFDSNGHVTSITPANDWGSGIAYIRFSAKNITSGSIITVNEEIE